MPSVKQQIRNLFDGQDYVYRGLFDAAFAGIKESTLRTAISDLRNPKYAGGPTLDIQVGPVRVVVVHRERLPAATNRYDWDALVAASKDAGETNDCGVKALAAATGRSYDRVNAFLIGGRYRKPRGGTRRYDAATRAFCKAEGLLVEHLPLLAGRRPTMRAAEELLQRQHAGVGAVLIVRGHAAGFNGAQVVDWTAGRRHRVHHILLIKNP